jgi:hypothetical protein
MKEQTAVEWLVNELENHHIKIDIKNTVAYQQAKAMEKEQIIDAYESYPVWPMSAEEFYTDTYGK